MRYHFEKTFYNHQILPNYYYQTNPTIKPSLQLPHATTTKIPPPRTSCRPKLEMHLAETSQDRTSCEMMVYNLLNSDPGYLMLLKPKSSCATIIITSATFRFIRWRFCVRVVLMFERG